MRQIDTQNLALCPLRKPDHKGRRMTPAERAHIRATIARRADLYRGKIAKNDVILNDFDSPAAAICNAIDQNNTFEDILLALAYLEREILPDTPPAQDEMHPPGPLAHLTDRDLLANLWFHTIVAIDAFGYDPATTEQSTIRTGQPNKSPGPSITLSDMMAEVETRLGITATSETTMDKPQ